VDINLDLSDAIRIPPSTPLHQAIAEGDPLPALPPLEKLNHADIAGRTALMMAADYGRADLIARLANARANPNAADIDGNTALSRAALAGHEPSVLALLEMGARPDTLDRWGRSPLTRAITGARPTVARALFRALQPQLSPEQRDVIFALAAKWASGPVLEELLQADPALATKPIASEGGRMPLAVAMDCPLTLASTVRALVQAGASASDADPATGRTPLMQALLARRPDLVQCLVREGATLDDVDHAGRSALFYAVRARDAVMVAYLVSKGVKNDLVDHSGRDVKAYIRDQKIRILIFGKDPFVEPVIMVDDCMAKRVVEEDATARRPGWKRDRSLDLPPPAYR
jgi:ankyrin repeat protein